MDRVSASISNRRFILFGALMVWLLFVASFFMPVTKGGDMIGWQAFSFYVAEMWDILDYWRHVADEPMAALVSTFPATNFAVFVAPLILWRWPRWALWLGLALALGGSVPLFGFYEMIVKNELRVGFYCWVISIFLMAVLSLMGTEGVRKRNT